MAQRMAERSDDQQDLALTEEEEAALVEQAKRRIQGKRIGAHRFYQFRLAFDRDPGEGRIQGHGG